MYCYWITEKSHWHLQALYIGIQKQTHYIIAITPDGFGVSPWKELNLVTSSIIHMIGLGIFFSFFYSRELLFTENDKLGVSSDNRVELQLITQQYFHNWNTNNHITNLKEVKKDSEISTNWNLLGCLSHPQLWKSALTVAEN